MDAATAAVKAATAIAITGVKDWLALKKRVDTLEKKIEKVEAKAPAAQHSTA